MIEPLETFFPDPELEEAGILELDDGSISFEMEEPLQTYYDYEELYPTLRNIARDVSEDERQKIAGMIYNDYEQDDASRQKWLEKMRTWLMLYNQEKTGSKPYDWMSQDQIPILTEAVNQFYTRSTQHLFSTTSFIRVRPFGNITLADIDAAKRVEKHLTYKLMIKNKKYKKDKKRLLKALPLYGQVFTKVYYDTTTKEVEVENVSAADLVYSYGIGPRNVEDVSRKTHCYYLSKYKGDKLVRNGFFLETPEIETSFDKSPKDEAAENKDGLTTPGDTTSAEQYKILEQHRFLQLESDEHEKPYIVWTCANSRKLLRIGMRWEVEKDQITPKGDFMPREYFTDYVYSENPDGAYGHGMGDFVGAANTSANKILQQCIDAGTLANIPTGFVSKALGLSGGELRIELGKFKKIDAMTDDLQKMLYQLKFPGPNQSLIQLMDAMVNRADRLAMVTDALTGTTEKVLQPTTILALIEQALQPYNSAMENVVDSLSRELQKIYKCSGEFMNEEEYFTLLDLDGNIEETDGYVTQSVAALDYELEMDIVPVADPKLATDQQRQSKAQAEYEFSMNNPLINQNPQSMYIASRRFLEAMEVPNINELLPPPQPPQFAPQGPGMPPEGGIPPELAGLLQGVEDVGPLTGPNQPGGAPQLAGPMGNPGNIEGIM